MFSPFLSVTVIEQLSGVVVISNSWISFSATDAQPDRPIKMIILSIDIIDLLLMVDFDRPYTLCKSGLSLENVFKSDIDSVVSLQLRRKTSFHIKVS